MFSLDRREVKAVVNEFLKMLGAQAIKICKQVGMFGIFIAEVLSISAKGVSLKKTIEQMYILGVNSLSVVALTGMSIGAVLAKHSYDGLHKFGAEDQFIGPLLYLSMTREFGPIISSIMLTARAGSAMAAELGTMKITEQIDALRTLSINPYSYLIIPRIVGATVAMPFLSTFCTMFGIASGYFIAVIVLGVGPEAYSDSIKKMLELSDIYNGLIKAAVFGFLSSTICCYKGISTRGGAKGVGTTTTQAVVYSCVTIFFANYILTSLLFHEK